jgi:hypothetical protein
VPHSSSLLLAELSLLQDKERVVNTNSYTTHFIVGILADLSLAYYYYGWDYNTYEEGILADFAVMMIPRQI